MPAVVLKFDGAIKPDLSNVTVIGLFDSLAAATAYGDNNLTMRKTAPSGNYWGWQAFELAPPQ